MPTWIRTNQNGHLEWNCQALRLRLSALLSLSARWTFWCLDLVPTASVSII